MNRPRFSTLAAATVIAVAAMLVFSVMLLDRAGQPVDGKTVVTVRLWDQQVAAGYRDSFAEFTRRHPGIEVHTNVVPYATYFDTLRTDVAGGGADDIFWLSNAYLAGYADTRRLVDVGADPAAFEPAVVDQFTRDGTLWAVPQLTDAGTAVYYNAELLAAAGVDPAALDELRWDPSGGDSLRPMLARLTLDADNNTADTPGFDTHRVRQWGYNAANDPQGIYLNYIGSAGGVFQRGEEFAFDNPAAIEAFGYLVGLINTDHVAPPASATNDSTDFARNQFLAGKMVLFQSGTYHLAPIADQAEFPWGVAMLPSGPAGRVSVTNGIAAAGNAASTRPEAMRKVLAWMGSSEGNAYLGSRGATIPAVRAAQRGYFDYWTTRGVDLTPFFEVLAGPRIPAPGGAGFAAGFTALKPYFNEMFLGRGDVATTLQTAQRAANTAARR